MRAAWRPRQRAPGTWLAVRERILPPEPREATEIAVGRGDAAAVVDRKRRQPGIGNQVSGRRHLPDQLAQDLAIAARGLRDPGGFTSEPLFDLLPGGAHGLGASEDTRIGHEPKEGQQTGPRQADPCAAVEPVVEPLSGHVMSFEVDDMGVDEDVRVDEDQRSESPSATARTSAMSSMWPIRHPPSETAFVVCLFRAP